MWKTHSTFRGGTLRFCKGAGAGTRKEDNIDCALVGLLCLFSLREESENREGFLIVIGLLVALAIISLLISYKDR